MVALCRGALCLAALPLPWLPECACRRCSKVQRSAPIGARLKAIAIVAFCKPCSAREHPMPAAPR